MRVIRVFPRRTAASPDDELAAFGPPKFWDRADEVHVSVTFSWDREEAERLAYEWEAVAPVKIGGPGVGTVGGDFTPGMYLKHGYVITSRGCPNRCWFCDVWKRDGDVKELPITDGWNVLDDNLLACSEKHICGVFAMLKGQDRRAEFTGGLEAARLKPWHVDLLTDLKPKQMFFAYDTPDDWEPLVDAVRMLEGAGFTRASHAIRCYVLVGYPGDTMKKAGKRINDATMAGLFPMAMLYRDKDGKTAKEWRRFQREWARPHIVASKVKGVA